MSTIFAGKGSAQLRELTGWLKMAAMLTTWSVTGAKQLAQQPGGGQPDHKRPQPTQRAARCRQIRPQALDLKYVRIALDVADRDAEVSSGALGRIPYQPPGEPLRLAPPGSQPDHPREDSNVAATADCNGGASDLKSGGSKTSSRPANLYQLRASTSSGSVPAGSGVTDRRASRTAWRTSGATR